MAFLAFTFINYLTQKYGAGDFTAYYGASVAVVRGIPLYPGFPGFLYLYPPLLAQFIAPVARIASPQAMLTLWFALNFSLTALSTLLLARYVPRPYRTLMLVLPILLLAVYDALWSGQVTLILYALAVGTWYAFRSRKPYLAGAILSVAIWIKLYPALLILYFLLKREWRVLIGVVSSSILLVVFQIVVSGTEPLVTYFTQVMPGLLMEGQIQYSYANQSILGFAQHLFAPSPFMTPLIDSPLLLAITRYGLILLQLAALVYLAVYPGTESRTRFDLEYAAALITSMMVSSSLSTYGYVSFLLPFGVVLMHLPVEQVSRRRVLAVLVVSCLLVSLSRFTPNVTTLIIPLPSLLYLSPFLGGILMWSLVIALLRQHLVHPVSEQPQWAAEGSVR